MSKFKTNMKEVLTGGDKKGGGIKLVLNERKD